MKFLKTIKDHKKGVPLPKRPKLTLLSDISLRSTGVGDFRMLVLDEAHLIKKPTGRSFAAISTLRDVCKSCVMMTGTPLDNTWLDAFALLSQLRGHPITSMQRMLHAFTDPDSEKQRQRVPTGAYLERFIQLMDAITIRCPKDALHTKLPPLTWEVVEYNERKEILEASDKHFAEFRKGGAVGSKKTGSTKAAKAKSDKQRMARFSALIKSRQLVQHAKLVEIMRLGREALLDAYQDDEPAQDLVVDKAGEAQLTEWRSKLLQDKGWRSTRVNAVVNLAYGHYDFRRHNSIIIVDESVYFLMILRMAFENKPSSPWKFFTLDGRTGVAEREHSLEQFRSMTGPRILFLSRGAGGLGLNLQEANVVIQCCPWWRDPWEVYGRVHRSKQEKPVYIYQVVARGAKVEEHKIAVRDRKNLTNKAVLDAITRLDTDELPERRF